MRTKFNSPIWFGIFFIAFTLSCQTKTSKESNDLTVTFGAVLPLSGEVASYGIDSKKGIDLAIELANSSQDSIRFAVEYQDSKGEPKSATNALLQLTSSLKPFAVIGENISSSTAAMIPIADRNKVILISPSASAPNLSGLSKYFFRVFPSDDSEGAFICKTVSDQFPDGNAAIIYVNNDYGVGLKNVFEREAEKYSLNIVSTQGFDPSQPDFQSLLLKVRQSNPDAIYIPSYYENGALLVKQIRENGISASIFGCTTHEDPKFIEIAGNAAEGFQYPVATGYDPNSTNPAVTSFISSYKNKYNEDPGLVTALGYDCAKILIDGVLTNGSSSDEIRNYILNIKPIEGAGGTMTFDVNGDVYKPVNLKQVKNGAFVKK